MVANTREERQKKREQWAARIKSWKASGMSVRAWCRKHKHVYSSFTYWKKKLLSNENANNMTPDSFVEIVDESNGDAGVAILIHGMVVQPSKDFDQTTLRRCLELLKRMSC